MFLLCNCLILFDCNVYILLYLILPAYNWLVPFIADVLNKKHT